MILDDLLGARVEDGEEEIKLTRSVKSFLDIPSKLSLGYIDVDLDHAQNVVFASIHDELEKNTKINIPIVMSQTQAKDLADKTLFLQRLSRINYHFTLPRTHLQYDPGDILPMLIDGRTVNLLITDIAYDPRGLLVFTAVENDVDLYDLSSNQAPSNPRPVVVRSVPESTFTALNIPYVTDDDQHATAVLVALSKTDWTGAALYVSYDNGVSYDPIAAQLTGTFFGTAGNVLGGAKSTVLDYGNTLSVTPDADQTATLENITIEQMLNGSNTLLVGSEIIRFAQADLQQDGSYLLSVLQRGIRGTEAEIDQHNSGERCYLLSSRTNLIIEAFRAFQVKALSFGSYNTLSSVSPVSATADAVGLRPYAPCHVKGVRSGDDLLITWQRRTRLDGDWRGAGEVPLAEASEQYEIDIMDGSTVARTIQTSSKNYTYTAEQQITDFGSVQPSISINIYQLSARYGRGTGTQAIL